MTSTVYSLLVERCESYNDYLYFREHDETYCIYFPILKRIGKSTENKAYLFVGGIKNKEDISGLLLFSEILSMLIIREFDSTDSFIKELCSQFSDTEFQDMTDREKDILKQISMGKIDDEIASNLHISKSTVRVYIKRLFDRTKTTSRAALISYYFTNTICNNLLG